MSLFLDANTKAKVKPVMTMTGVREFIDDQYIPVEMVRIYVYFLFISVYMRISISISIYLSQQIKFCSS